MRWSEIAFGRTTRAIAIILMLAVSVASCGAPAAVSDNSLAISNLNFRINALQQQIDQQKQKLDNIYICKQQLNNAISAVPCE